MERGWEEIWEELVSKKVQSMKTQQIKKTKHLTKENYLIKTKHLIKKKTKHLIKHTLHSKAQKLQLRGGERFYAEESELSLKTLQLHHKFGLGLQMEDLKEIWVMEEEWVKGWGWKLRGFVMEALEEAMKD